MGYMRDEGGVRLDSISVQPAPRSARRPRRLPHGLGFQLNQRHTLAPSSSGWDSFNAGIGYDIFYVPALGKYGMLYAAWDNTTTTKIGFAEADHLDGVWTKNAANPVLVPNATPGQQDSGGLTFPQVHHENGIWYVYCAAFPGAGYEVGNPAVMLYTATDIKNGPFTRQGVVLTAGQFPYAGASGQVWRATPVKVGRKYYLFANAGPAPGQEKIHYAVSDSPAGPFIAGNSGQPVIEPTAIGDLSNTLVSDPDLFQIGSTMVMVFWAQTSGLWYATSDLATEFPNTWHVNQTRMANTTGYVRPVYVEGPLGARLFAHTANQRVDQFVPTAAVPPVRPVELRTTSGRFYRTGGALTFANATAGAGFQTYHPITFDTPTTIFGLCVNVTATVAATLRLGIYTDNKLRSYPEFKLAEGTTSADASTLGAKTFTFSPSLVVPPGTYWLSCVAQGGSPGLTNIATAAHPQATSTTLTEMFGNWTGYVVSGGGITGSMPTTAPNGLASATGSIPLVVVQT